MKSVKSMKRSNPQLSEPDTSIGFFPNTKRAKTEPKTAEAALATIPCISHDIPLFQPDGAEDPWNKCYSSRTVWDRLENPVNTVPGHHVDLSYLRELADKGLMTAIPYSTPTVNESLLKSAHQLLAGGPVVYAKSSAMNIRLAGVVFHPGNSTLTAHVRGEANPHLGYGRQHGRNKLWEWKFVSRIDPKAMPETISIDELPVWTDPELVEFRRSIHENMTQIVIGKTNEFTNKTIKEIASYIKSIFTALRIRFPDGAFIKPVESSCSGDFGGIVTTMSSKEEELANLFAIGMPSILRDLARNSQNIEPSMMRTTLLSKSNPIFLIVHDLLFEPREVIGQKALELAKTERGHSFEVRVDFIQGKAVRSVMRYYLADYYPRETKAAADFLDRFFKKANYQNRMLSGGADIALGQDGNWHIIEFNFGAESFGLNFGTNWNCYVSSFLGRNTDLITTYEAMFAAPLNEQQKFLIGLEKSVLNHPDVDDLSEVYLWFRDRYCELFAAHPTYRQRGLILEKLTKLFGIAPLDQQDYVANLIELAKLYMDRELAHFNFTERQLFFTKDNIKPDPVCLWQGQAILSGTRKM